MIVCFDTSAINHLANDPDCAKLAQRMATDVETYITALNVVEISKTANSNRRETLRKICEQLAANREPLALPNELLENVARAFQQKARSIMITIPADQRELWILLSRPDALLDGGREELERWTAANERLHAAPAAPLRASVAALFATAPHNRPNSPASVLRQLIAARCDLHYALPSQFYKLAIGHVLPLSRLDRFLQEARGIWSVFLASVAMSVYYAAIWIPDHGARNKVGVLDLWSAVYLPLCDVFVTNDLKNGGQYEALRVVNVLNGRKPRTKILRWHEFRGAVISGRLTALTS
jgi:uncharacterized protein with PIN domain